MSIHPVRYMQIYSYVLSCYIYVYVNMYIYIQKENIKYKYKYKIQPQKPIHTVISFKIT